MIKYPNIYLSSASCPNLEYLALTQINLQMDDEDMTNFAKYCPNLEQLDLLGVRGFTDVGVSFSLKCGMFTNPYEIL